MTALAKIKPSKVVPLALSLTRNTPRWVWNEQGQLEEVPIDQPCFEYDPVTHEPRGLYLNAASVTNVITNSAPTSLSQIETRGGDGLSIVSDMPAPFVNGVHFAMDTATTGSYAYKTFTGAQDGDVYTFKCFVRMDDGSKPVLAASTVDTNGDFLVVVYQKLAHSAKIIKVGSGLYEVSWSGTWHTGDARNGGIVSYQGNSNKPFTVTGYQMTKTPYPAHYIPTNGTAVTVAGDSCSLANLPIDYGTPGAFVFEFETISDPFSSSGIEYLSSGEYPRRYLCLILPGNGEEIRSYDGTNITGIGNIGNIAGLVSKFVLAWDANTAKISYNGSPVSSGPHNGTFGTRSELKLFTASGNSAAGYVRKLRYIPSTTILSDAQCIAEATI